MTMYHLSVVLLLLAGHALADIPKPGEPDIPKPGEPNIPKPGEPDIPKPGEPDIPKPGEPNIPKPGEPEIPMPSAADDPPPMPGAPVDHPITDEDRTAAVAAIATELNGKAGVGEPLVQLQSVDSVKTQVVAGVMTTYHITIHESDCVKQEDTDEAGLSAIECGLSESAEPETCTIEIWEKPWMDFKETTVKCESHNQLPRERVSIN